MTDPAPKLSVYIPADITVRLVRGAADEAHRKATVGARRERRTQKVMAETLHALADVFEAFEVEESALLGATGTGEYLHWFDGEHTRT